MDIPIEIRNTVGRGTSLFRTINIVNDLFKGKPINILETGTTRGILGGGPVGDGWATILWGWYAKQTGSTVYTIDMNSECLEECKRLTKEFKDNIKYIHGVSTKELTLIEEEIHLLYLDSGNDPELMYKEFLLAEKNLVKNSLILLDDVGIDIDTGKGKILVPHLTKNENYIPIYHDTNPTTNQTLFQKVY